MENNKEDWEKLFDERAKLIGLLNSSSKVLEGHYVSEVRQDFEKVVSNNSTKFAVQLQKAIQKGRIEEIVIVAAIVGIPYLGTKMYDEIVDLKSKAKAKDAMLRYYKELAVRTDKIIALLIETNKEYEKENYILSEKTKQLEERMDFCEKWLSEKIAFDKSVL